MPLFRDLVLVGVALNGFGCAAVCRSPATSVSTQDSNRFVELSAYSPRFERVQRVYNRMNPSRTHESPAHYVQSEDNHGREEGLLVGHVDWPLSIYLDPHSNRPGRPKLKWPTPPRRGTEAVFVEFHPPTDEWPRVVRKGVTEEWQVEMSAYDRDGVPFARGLATRRVVWDGYELVEINGAAYPDSLRLQVETNLSFGWWANIRARETVWLARHIGVVRRIERLSGHALLLFRFGSTHEYALHGCEGKESSDTATDAPRRRWARLAVYLDRSVPRPRVGGLAVEWAE